jgi:hypothetical protein
MLTLIFCLAMQAKAQARPLDGNGNRVVGGRPAGCPHAYCGCGLRLYLGLRDARLNLARNWARMFPPTRAQPGAVAVKSHHVMLLVAHSGGSDWLVHDWNSGGGLTRIHVRSVKGFTFVSPTIHSVPQRSQIADLDGERRHLRTHKASSTRGRHNTVTVGDPSRSWRT